MDLVQSKGCRAGKHQDRGVEKDCEAVVDLEVVGGKHWGMEDTAIHSLVVSQLPDYFVRL